MNEHTYKLVICLDKKGKKGILLKEGTIDKIDKITTSYNDSKELRNNYFEQEEAFRRLYKKDIERMQNKNKKRETGDITIIDPQKVDIIDIPREDIIYNGDVDKFELAIEDKGFMEFIRKADYSKYCALNGYNYKITEKISWLIRELPKIYDEYSKKHNTPSLKTIYKQKLKEIERLKKRRMMRFDENAEEELTEKNLEAYEAGYIQERRESQKYYIEEENGKQKIKKISGEK